jgi:hypothetical protein
MHTGHRHRDDYQGVWSPDVLFRHALHSVDQVIVVVGDQS